MTAAVSVNICWLAAGRSLTTWTISNECKILTGGQGDPKLIRKTRPKKCYSLSLKRRVNEMESDRQADSFIHWLSSPRIQESSSDRHATTY